MDPEELCSILLNIDNAVDFTQFTLAYGNDDQYVKLLCGYCSMKRADSWVKANIIWLKPFMTRQPTEISSLFGRARWYISGMRYDIADEDLGHG